MLLFKLLQSFLFIYTGNYVFISFSVYPAQNDKFGDDNFFSSDDDDYDPFAEDPLTAAFEDGSEIWEDK